MVTIPLSRYQLIRERADKDILQKGILITLIMKQAKKATQEDIVWLKELLTESIKDSMEGKEGGDMEF